MAIVNLEKTAIHISNWIKEYATKAGIKTLVVGLSGGIDSALVALLCKRTNIPVLCINMPCHSSDSAYNRAKAFADEYALNLVKIDLSSAHDIIYGQAKRSEVSNTKFDAIKPIAVGGLRSCLRAPTLSFFANATNGLIVGTGNRSEDNITRYFQKYGDGCVDISPISDLFKGEVYELFKYLSSMKSSLKEGEVLPPSGTCGNLAAQAIYDAKPTADLWGPDSGQEDEKELGISYDEIEWADREDMRTQENISHTDFYTHRYGIVKRDADPAKHPAWLGYTGRQRAVISKLYQMEKTSRHKFNANLPICEVRKVPGLVR